MQQQQQQQSLSVPNKLG
uniref:Uncharacterized protein n=1 Tax=Arundo donax TaxID=35708 RepID=A0A0A9H885_ARUDO